MTRQKRKIADLTNTIRIKSIETNESFEEDMTQPKSQTEILVNDDQCAEDDTNTKLSGLERATADDENCGYSSSSSVPDKISDDLEVKPFTSCSTEFDHLIKCCEILSDSTTSDSSPCKPPASAILGELFRKRPYPFTSVVDTPDVSECKREKMTDANPEICDGRLAVTIPETTKEIPFEIKPIVSLEMKPSLNDLKVPQLLQILDQIPLPIQSLSSFVKIPISGHVENNTNIVVNPSHVPNGLPQLANSLPSCSSTGLLTEARISTQNFDVHVPPKSVSQAPHIRGLPIALFGPSHINSQIKQFIDRTRALGNRHQTPNISPIARMCTSIADDDMPTDLSMKTLKRLEEKRCDDAQLECLQMEQDEPLNLSIKKSSPMNPPSFAGPSRAVNDMSTIRLQLGPASAASTSQGFSSLGPQLLSFNSTDISRSINLPSLYFSQPSLALDSRSAVPLSPLCRPSSVPISVGQYNSLYRPPNVSLSSAQLASLSRPPPNVAVSVGQLASLYRPPNMTVSAAQQLASLYRPQNVAVTSAGAQLNNLYRSLTPQQISSLYRLPLSTSATAAQFSPLYRPQNVTASAAQHVSTVVTPVLAGSRPPSRSRSHRRRNTTLLPPLSLPSPLNISQAQVSIPFYYSYPLPTHHLFSKNTHHLFFK